MPKKVRNVSDKITLDRIDVDLLHLLQDDARMTNKEMAQRVGLSASATLERVRRLITTGVVRGMHADLEPTAVGIGLSALLMVRLQRHTRTVIDAFQRHCHELEEIVGLWHLTGSSDYVAHVVARDHEHLRDFLMDSFTTRPEVAHLETHVVLWEEHATRWPVWH